MPNNNPIWKWAKGLNRHITKVCVCIYTYRQHTGIWKDVHHLTSFAKGYLEWDTTAPLLECPILKTQTISNALTLRWKMPGVFSRAKEYMHINKAKGQIADWKNDLQHNREKKVQHPWHAENLYKLVFKKNRNVGPIAHTNGQFANLGMSLHICRKSDRHKDPLSITNREIKITET